MQKSGIDKPNSAVYGVTMNMKRKKLDEAAILRMFRAALALDQCQVANMAGISLRTLQLAETGRPSVKTLAKLHIVYSVAGLRLSCLPALCGDIVPIITFDTEIAPSEQ